ncbi:M60 family metallopeptidase [Spartinivicinus ruber]
MGPYHEVGHNYQQHDWMFDTIEVTNNYGNMVYK